MLPLPTLQDTRGLACLLSASDSILPKGGGGGLKKASMTHLVQCHRVLLPDHHLLHGSYLGERPPQTRNQQVREATTKGTRWRTAASFLCDPGGLLPPLQSGFFPPLFPCTPASNPSLLRPFPCTSHYRMPAFCSNVVCKTPHFLFQSRLGGVGACSLGNSGVIYLLFELTCFRKALIVISAYLGF